MKFGCFDTPPIFFVDNSTYKKFPQSTWLSTKHNEIKFPGFSIFSQYRSKQQIYFQDSTGFRKIKQPLNTMVFLAETKDRILRIPDIPSGCWQILYYGAFDLIQERYGVTQRRKLEQNSTDDWSLVQIQLNSSSYINFTTKEWKKRGNFHQNTFWILGDIRECFGDVRVSKLVVPAGVRIEDIRCTAIKTGTTFTFSFSNSSPLIASTTRVVVSTDAWFYVSMTTVAMLIAILIALGLMLWYHPIWCCVKSDRNGDLARLEFRNPNPNVSSSTRYITSNCQSSALVEEVVYDEINISKKPGPSGKSYEISNQLYHSIVPKSQNLESNDDVIYDEIKITAHPGPSSESSAVYYSNHKTKEVYDRPSSAMYNNVDSQDDVIYENKN
ncbi:hypothetical protein B566_EDAN015173 [Ephemera danica]|nr:hypothetical protein B566_EDAN015173 [Ephemera danica]